MCGHKCRLAPSSHTATHRVIQITRQLSPGVLDRATALVHRSHRGRLLTTAFLEHFHATMRERVATRTHMCLHASQCVAALHAGMDLLGTTDHFWWEHPGIAFGARWDHGETASGPCAHTGDGGRTDGPRLGAPVRVSRRCPHGPDVSSGRRGKRPASSLGKALGGKPADTAPERLSRMGHPGSPCALC